MHFIARRVVVFRNTLHMNFKLNGLLKFPHCSSSECMTGTAGENAWAAMLLHPGMP